MHRIARPTRFRTLAGPWILATAVALLLPLPSSAQPAAGERSAQSRHEAARTEYDVGHYAAAFEAFAALADVGHCESARIARQMVQHGRALYGLSFTATPERIDRWRRLGGCPAALASAR